MNVAIIGTGKVGRALGSTLARAGHRVYYGARNEGKAKAAASTLNGRSFGICEAAQRADTIILAVPYAAIRQVASEIAGVAAGKVVVDVTSPGPETRGGPSAAESLAVWLPDAHVVKAFNTLFVKIQADPKLHGVELDALFATDDPSARATMAALLESMGFRPVHVGPLERARELEALGNLLIQLESGSGGSWQSAFSLTGAPASALGQPSAADSTVKAK
jgi:predicted dinucleotide-binding enzyme